MSHPSLVSHLDPHAEAALAAELAAALENPALRPVVRGALGPQLGPRVARYYEQLRLLPRRVRRRLQRRWKRSLAGVAMLLALGATPTQATTFNVAASDEPGLIAAITAANDETAHPGPDTIVL